MPLAILAFWAKTPQWIKTLAIVAGSIVAMVAFCFFVAWAYTGQLEKASERGAEKDRTDASLIAANKTIAANERATADQATSTATATNLQIEVQHEATTKSDNSSVGPGTAAVLRRVREQQAAGRR